jgi:aromatic-L-amino-acid decarboxylase
MAAKEDAPYWPLERTPEELKRMVSETMERVAVHIASLPSQPSADLEGGAEVARSLAEPLPEQGSDLAGALAVLFDRAIPKSLNAAGPGYLAYIPGGGIFEAAIADLIANSANRYTGLWLPAPALVQLETNVIRWLCGIVGYPEGSLGFLTTGGSLANLSALITARTERLPKNFLGGTLYVSDQAHHSLAKAARLAGFPADSVRVVETDGSFRMRLDRLEAMIEADRAAGRVPFFVCGSAGTTNTGAVDDLPALADIAARRSLWFHVDAAYGGFFMMTERGKRTLAGIERADSIVLDPHKGLFLPYGTGCLLTKDGGALRRAHSVPAIYLPPSQEDPDRVDFAEISPELTRDYRGLRVWLPLKLHGAAAFRKALDEKLDLAEWAHAQLARIPEVEIVAPPQLSALAFRVMRTGAGGDGGETFDETNRLNRRILERINGRKRIHLSGTTLDGRFVIRICVLSFRTHADRMEMGLEDIRSAIAESVQ